MEFGAAGIRALADLMKTKDDSDSEDEMPKSAMASMHPGDVGPQTKPQANSVSPDTQSSSKNSADIWDADEVNEGQEFDDIHDPRPQPEYDIVYKQAVRAEDMYLGTSNKTPATSSCEDMVVKINLPDTRSADVELDVKTKFLDCRTPKYKLGLHLPYPVNSKNGRAQWDGKKFLLTVTLPMTRDYDFVNF